MIDMLFSGGIVLVLLFSGVFFWFYLRLSPFRRMAKEKKEGRASSFRALAVALAGTLGIGNIAGVAIALLSGGAGALFWMWVSAFFAMILKYAEITLACRYRTASGHGGAMYYMRQGLGGRIGRVAGAIFALLCLALAFWMGGLLQSETVLFCAASVFGGSPYLYGACLALLVALVLFGGVKSVSAASVRLVPLMSALYIAMCLGVIFLNRASLGDVLYRVLAGAFHPLAAGGGIGAFIFSSSLRSGFATGLLSNEAGCGTAPMAHVTANASVDPVRQGRMGMLEVALDTLFICTLSGLAILCAFPVLPQGVDAMALCLRTFVASYGKSAGYLLSLALFCFAYATMICWGYYGESCVRYFSSSRVWIFLFRTVYCVFVFGGCLFSSGAAFAFTDRLLGCMTLLNAFTLLALARKVKYGK